MVYVYDWVHSQIIRWLYFYCVVTIPTQEKLVYSHSLSHLLVIYVHEKSTGRNAERQLVGPLNVNTHPVTLQKGQRVADLCPIDPVTPQIDEPPLDTTMI